MKHMTFIIIFAVILLILIGHVSYVRWQVTANSDHAYGEKVGDVAAPSLNECVLNGYYYPVSSGKCTVNATGIKWVQVAGSGGAGGVIVPETVIPTPTPWPEDLKAENQTHGTYCYEEQRIGTASGVSWDYVCKTVPLPHCNGTWYNTGINSTSMICIGADGSPVWDLRS